MPPPGILYDEGISSIRNTTDSREPVATKSESGVPKDEANTAANRA